MSQSSPTLGPHRCPFCGGELSQAFVCVQGQAHNICQMVELGQFEITCDHCGLTFWAAKLLGIDLQKGEGDSHDQE